MVTILRNGIGRDMKSFKSKLTEEQMRAVTAYMPTLARKEGP